MVVLALDQSSHINGYAVFQNDKLLKYGKFSLNDNDIGKRLVNFRQQIIELIENYSPDMVIFEDIQQQNNIANNIQTFKILAEVYGILFELLTSLNINHTSILASSWKSGLKISGKTRPEQKKNTQNYVINKYNVTPTQDECDAICIGEYYIHSQKTPWD